MAYADLLGAANVLAYVFVFAITAGETSAFLGLIVPGEVALLTAGVLASQGQLDPAPLIGVAIAGAVVGDQVGYLLGRRYGFRWLDRRPRWRRRLTRVRAWTSGRYAGLAIVAGRFVGYVRPLVPFAAGVAGMGYRRFFAYSSPAAMMWAAGSVLVGIGFGASGSRLVETFGIGATVLLAMAIIVGVAVLRFRRSRRREPLAAAAVRTSDLERERQPVG